MLSKRMLCAENQIKSACPAPQLSPGVINSLSLEHLSSSKEACRKTMFRTQHCLIPFTTSEPDHPKEEDSPVSEGGDAYLLKLQRSIMLHGSIPDGWDL